MANKDYYSILGVARDASQDDIKKAFRKLAHKHHPDKQGGDEAKFKEANEAYGVLSDSEKRKRYDQFGTADGPAGFGGFSQGGGGFDFGDFQFGGGAGGFEDLFSDIFTGGRSTGRSRGPRPGSDIQVDVEISFADMVSGTERSVRLRKTMSCRDCGGTGGKKGSKEITCEECSGKGQVRQTVRSVLGVFEQVIACQKCHGTGKRFAEACPTCHGSGRITGEEEISVRIPAGIDDGQVISIPGKGSAGEPGAPAGDLYVSVRVTPHPSFERRGGNILSRLPISFSQATLGDTVTVETAHGPVRMKIPAGTQPGEVFRIKGKGLRDVRGFGQGDHLVTVSVTVPKHVSGKEKKLIEELRGLEKR
ncbi:MAG: molecular chaperone DnaJ [Candidatus Moranbacteria bacterium]|nr:molecular chaperone DnaJ [Candidatus Moranbacteria bacterium]NTW75697.1 molecular chaperone DnaJ [Candidatus Moranbacteria bacterium]